MTITDSESSTNAAPTTRPAESLPAERPDGVFTWIVVSFMAVVLLGNMPTFSLWAADVTGQSAQQAGLLIVLGLSIGFGLLFWVIDRVTSR